MDHSREEEAKPPLPQPVKIVSWMGGEHWYIGEKKFLRLEEAIRYCVLQGLNYEVIEDPNHFYKKDGD